MDSIEIDKIIYFMENNQLENLYNYFRKYKLLSKDNISPYKIKFLKKIANEIDDKCFNSIYTYLAEDKNISSKKINVFAEILMYMSDERKKLCIENIQFDNINLANIINSISDVEYRKKCINNDKKFNLKPVDKLKIIKNIGQIEFSKQCIERNREVGLGSNEIFELIKSTNDPNFIKQCIESDSDVNKYKLYAYQVIELIYLTKDDDFMRNCIENSDKFGLAKGQLYDIIININDSNFLKDYVERRKEFALNRNQLTEIIKKTNDLKYILKCILHKEEYGFLAMHVFDIIKDIKDPKFIKKCLYSNNELGLESYMIKSLLNNIDDPEFTKKCVKNYKKIKINSFAVINIIDSLNDSKFTKKCVFNKKLGLDSSEIKYLIISLKNDKFTEKCISEAKKIGLNSEDIECLIGLINNNEYTKKCILNGKKLGIKSSYISELIINLKDEEFAKKCIKNNKKIGLDTNDLKYLQILYDKEYQKLLELQKTKSKINLPDEMTIGIEIEFCSKSKMAIERLKRKFFDEWNIERDVSIKPDKQSEYGIEISSPILKGAEKNNNKEIGKVCKILKDVENYTNESCGGHIHIGTNYLKTAQGWKNLLELWSNTEEILYIISNEKGNIPRKDIVTYAIPISLRIKKSLKKEKIKLNEIKDVQSLKKEIKKIMTENYRGVVRYRGINFSNITNIEEKSTIEIRMPNGTINPETWIENINLFGGIIKISQEIADIQSKNENDLTDEEKQKLDKFNKIKRKRIKKREKLQALLDLVIEKKEQENYIERYDINNKLLKEKPKFRQELKVDISKKPVKINKKESKKEKVKQEIKE